MEAWGYALAQGFPVGVPAHAIHKAFTMMLHDDGVKIALRRCLLGMLLLVAGTVAAMGASSTSVTWNIEVARSSAAFTATHFFVTHVRGTIPIKHATIKMAEASNIPSSADAALDPAGVDTGNGNRDNDLRSGHFFEAKTYPLISFESTRIVATDDRHFTMQGNLTMHGATHPITLNAQLISRAGNRIGFSAHGSIDRRDWGMTYGAPVVSNNIDIDLTIEAVRG